MIGYKEQILSLLLAVAIDRCIGDPSFLPHPIVMMGSMIAWFERQIRKVCGESHQKAGGFVLVIVMIASTVLIGGALEKILFFFPMAVRIGLRAFAMSFMLAAKSLKTESLRVWEALEKADLESARNAVGRIVGRDVQNLDRQGVIRAAVETVAENFSDGVIAPLLYMACFGFLGGAVYKAVNTMDSMVGYKNEKYRDFGFVAAKVDDAANFLPARISALLMIAASQFGFRFRNAVRIFLRDRFLSSSPNSGQTEAVCAGALGIRLLGDAYYFGKLVRKPYIGDALQEIEVDDIRRANRLNEIAYLLALCVLSAFGFWGNAWFY